METTTETKTKRVKKPRSGLATLAQSARRKRMAAQIPTHDDPRAELRLLVKRHRSLTKAKVALGHMHSNRVNRETGEEIPCLLPDSIRAELSALADKSGKEADALKSKMERELRKLPIYTLFLEKVFGSGAVVAGNLCAAIEIAKAEKPSQLKRYCGYAIVNGKLERATKPERGVERNRHHNGTDGRRRTDGGRHYNSQLRTTIFSLFTAMAKNAAKRTICEAHAATKPGNKAKQSDKQAHRAATLACRDCRNTKLPFGQTTKYLKIWTDSKYGTMHSDRVRDGKMLNEDGSWMIRKSNDGKVHHVSAQGFAHSKGWHKAASIFIDDLYMVWRALEGLPVWPTYFEARLQHTHGGAKIADLAPRMLTIDEALERVGFVGGVPAERPTDIDAPEASEGDDIDTDLVDEDVSDAAE